MQILFGNHKDKIISSIFESRALKYRTKKGYLNGPCQLLVGAWRIITYSPLSLDQLGGLEMSSLSQWLDASVGHVTMTTVLNL